MPSFRLLQSLSDRKSGSDGRRIVMQRRSHWIRQRAASSFAAYYRHAMRWPIAGVLARAVPLLHRPASIRNEAAAIPRRLPCVPRLPRRSRSWRGVRHCRLAPAAKRSLLRRFVPDGCCRPEGSERVGQRWLGRPPFNLPSHSRACGDLHNEFARTVGALPGGGGHRIGGEPDSSRASSFDRLWGWRVLPPPVMARIVRWRDTTWRPESATSTSSRALRVLTRSIEGRGRSGIVLFPPIPHSGRATRAHDQ